MRFWKFCIFFVGYVQIWQEVWIKGGPVNATEEKQTPGANYGFIENLVRCGGAYSMSQETDSEQMFCLP